MRVDLFDFDLPPERIALRPAVPREMARLMVLPRAEPASHRRVADLPDLLRPGDAIVVNDTRVIPARLRGHRSRDGRIARFEVMLHRRLAPDLWLAFARPAKRLARADRVAFGRERSGAAGGDSPAELHASVEETLPAGEIALRFDLSGTALDTAIAARGELPLPPYIASRRAVDDSDESDYQTTFAAEPGAVAAPTAGLHFTEKLIEKIELSGISVHRLTLHVGAGTFLPVRAETTRAHRMHPEWGRLGRDTADALNAARARGGRIVAVGTTSLRILESAADSEGALRPFEGTTEIFITPGYRFKAVDVLMTNFHLPRSTLFMLVSAFVGLERIQAAYREAVSSGYRFYSYGDACLLERDAGA